MQDLNSLGSQSLLAQKIGSKSIAIPILAPKMRSKSRNVLLRCPDPPHSFKDQKNFLRNKMIAINLPLKKI